MEQHIDFVVWDAAGNASYLRSSKHLVRWIQAHGLSNLHVWRIDHDLEQIAGGWLTWDHIGAKWVLTTESGDRVRSYPPDPSRDPRALAVVDFVEERLDETMHCFRIAEADWNTADPDDPVGTYARFGFLPPVQHATGGSWQFRYCPDIIARQTARLDQREFEMYLHTLDVRIALNIVHATLPALEREHHIESALYDMSPDDAAMLNRVQMEALDGE